jgi:hypothetical protein
LKGNKAGSVLIPENSEDGRPIWIIEEKGDELALGRLPGKKYHHSVCESFFGPDTLSPGTSSHHMANKVEPYPALIICKDEPMLNHVVVSIEPDAQCNPIITPVNDLKLEAKIAVMEFGDCTLLDLNDYQEIDVRPRHKPIKSTRHAFWKTCEEHVIESEQK